VVSTTLVARMIYLFDSVSRMIYLSDSEIFLLDRPFIPDFIPAVGDIDAFIRVPRPDGQPEVRNDVMRRFGFLLVKLM